MRVAEKPVVHNSMEESQKSLNFPGVNAVEAELNIILKSSDGIIKDMCTSLLKAGGKRLRPILVILSGLCFSELTDEIIKTAVASELIHMASLVHDDIIDKSDSRRGSATINALYGNHPAVLAGDFVFAKAYEVLSVNRLLKGMEYLTAAIQQMCDGEINQAVQKYDMDVTVEEYYKRIEKKTASLISACCRAGAAAGNAGQRDIDILGEYGLNIGLAFQIMDDVLDFTGDAKRTGKPRYIDLLEGNITLPVILLMKDMEYGGWVKDVLKKGFVEAGELESINKAVIESGILKNTIDAAKEMTDRAKSAISCFDDSCYRSALMDIADKVINRDH